MQWDRVDLAGEPVLVLGWRPKRGALEAGTVDLHEDTFGELRAIGDNVVGNLRDREPVPWERNAEPEPGDEYLHLSVDDLPRVPGTDDVDVDDPDVGDSAALLELVLNPGELAELHPEQVAEQTFLFYALVWEEGLEGEAIAFVTQHNPAVALKARKYFRFDGALTLMDRPDLALKEHADIVLTREEVIVVHTTAFNRLFSDIRTLLENVPGRVDDLAKVIGLPMTSGAASALTRVCSERPLFARRLARLLSDGTVAAIPAPVMRRTLANRQLDARDFIDSSGRLKFNDANVREFLDLLEGRYYDADFTDEARRAGRWTRRGGR